MPQIVYTSDAPPTRKGWAAFDRSVQWALGVIGRPATFDEVAALLPDGIHYPLILESLRSIADYGDHGWQLRFEARAMSKAGNVAVSPTATVSCGCFRTARSRNSSRGQWRCGSGGNVTGSWSGSSPATGTSRGVSRLMRCCLSSNSSALLTPHKPRTPVKEITIMDLDQFPLSAFEVDCDGSACSSTRVGRHIHPPQDSRPAIARVRIVERERVEYSDAEGIERLVMVAA